MCIFQCKTARQFEAACTIEKLFASSNSGQRQMVFNIVRKAITGQNALFKTMVVSGSTIYGGNYFSRNFLSANEYH